MALASGYSLNLRNNAIRADAYVGVTPLSVGWTQTHDSETVTHTLAVTWVFKRPWRFWLRDRNSRYMLPGMMWQPLARNSALSFGAMHVAQVAQDTTAIPGLIWADTVDHLDFISVCYSDSRPACNTDYLVVRNMTVHNDPEKKYYMKATKVSIFTPRAKFREYLMDPKHIFVMINPFFPWHRRWWLMWYFWLPLDFQGRSEYSHVHTEAVADVVAPNEPQPPQEQPRRSQRLLRQH